MKQDDACSSKGGRPYKQSGKKVRNSALADKKDHPIVQATNGNFKNYYAIRRDVLQNTSQKGTGIGISDRRVQAITTWINAHKMVGGTTCRKIERYLDIGCNTGQCTFELAQHLKEQPKHIIAVDLDEDLVRRADVIAESYGYQQSHNVSAGRLLGSGRVGYSKWQPRKRLRLEEPAEACVATIFACDWTYMTCIEEEVQSKLQVQNHQGYDLITALSITKWVQLAHADAGIRAFFARICNSLKPGGLFILEPQPFKSYKGLHKITKPESKERQNIAQMKVYPDDFPCLLTVELGLIGPFFIRHRGQDGFMRDIQAYLQPETADSACLLYRDNILKKGGEEIPWVQRDRQ